MLATNSEFFRHWASHQFVTSEGKFKPPNTHAYVFSNNVYLPWGSKQATNFKIPYRGNKYH